MKVKNIERDEAQFRAYKDIRAYLGLTNYYFSQFIEHLVISRRNKQLSGIIGNSVSYLIKPILNSNHANLILKSTDKVIIAYIEFTEQNSFIIHGYAKSFAKE